MNTNAKKIVKVAGLSIFFLLMVGYAFFVGKGVIFGEKIKNVAINGSPLVSGMTFHTSTVKITGTAKNAVKLYLDGRELSVDESGHFNETIALLAGYNIINIKAEDKFGDVDEKNYQIMYTESAAL